MVSNTLVQNPDKHFDLLISRKIVLIKRQHEQNLITYKKLEKIILHESKRIPICRGKKISIPLDEVYKEKNAIINQHEKRMQTNDDPIENSDVPMDNSDNLPDQLDDKPSQPVPKYRRPCVKARRLPPIVPSHVTNREKRSSNPVDRMSSAQQSNKQNENVNGIYVAFHQELSKRILRETSHVSKQIHSFMGTLPAYKGAQKGFDNFASSALYSTRATVAIR